MTLKQNMTYQNQGCDKYGIFLLSAPRAWGCFHFTTEETEGTGVCPTCVGMFQDLY